MHGVGTWLNFRKRNQLLETPEGNSGKTNTKNNLFYLPCSVLEFKLSSNSVKLDSAKKWHRRLGHLNQADVVRNAPETVGELDDI